MRVSIEVPASTANVGPGFDCLGLALELRNHLEVAQTTHGLQVEIEGEGEDLLPRDASNRTVQAAFAIFDRLGVRPRGLRVRCINRIPLGSGLGSSAAAAVAGALAADALVSGGLSREQILGVVYEIEGHADNAAASLYGGLNVVASDADGILVRQLPAARLELAIAVPDVALPTPAMRQALPDSIPLKDAVFNLGHTLLLTEALRTGDLDLLAFAARDRLHQPFRIPHIPGFGEAEAAARAAGARAVTLSGAGPGVVAFGGEPSEVTEAMIRGFQQAGVGCRSWVLPLAARGASVQTVDDASQPA
jgi:homoserine kinase